MKTSLYILVNDYVANMRYCNEMTDIHFKRWFVSTLDPKPRCCVNLGFAMNQRIFFWTDSMVLLPHPNNNGIMDHSQSITTSYKVHTFWKICEKQPHVKCTYTSECRNRRHSELRILKFHKSCNMMMCPFAKAYMRQWVNKIEASNLSWKRIISCVYVLIKTYEYPVQLCVL